MLTDLIDDLVLSLSTDLIADGKGDTNLYNLELENGSNYLFEDGGLIILE